jgi:4-hydroxy-3-methylbut-2-enyl diphosphate reductase IspH
LKLDTDSGVFTPEGHRDGVGGIEEDDKDKFLAFTPHGTVTAGRVRLIDRRGQAVEVTCPTVTESFSIVESDQIYGQYISQ